MRGEASDGGGARTKASWWRCHHVRQSRSMQGQSVLEGSCCGSRDRILSSMLGPPLQRPMNPEQVSHYMKKGDDASLSGLASQTTARQGSLLGILDVGSGILASLAAVSFPLEVLAQFAAVAGLAVQPGRSSDAVSPQRNSRRWSQHYIQSSEL